MRRSEEVLPPLKLLERENSNGHQRFALVWSRTGNFKKDGHQLDLQKVCAQSGIS